MDIEQNINDAFGSGKEYIIFYQKGCYFSESALSDCDDNINSRKDISNLKDTYMPKIRAHFQKDPNNIDINGKLDRHNTYPIIFRKINDKFHFIGGYTEYIDQKNAHANTIQLQMGGGHKRYRYVLTNITL